jgi:NitT/TauT family transport system permease protein
MSRTSDGGMTSVDIKSGERHVKVQSGEGGWPSLKKAPAALLPAVVGVFLIAAWEIIVRALDVPVYVLPGPVSIARAMVSDWGTLSSSLLITLRSTLGALALAVVLAVVTAFAFSQSKILERTFFPYAVILQVTPTVSIAPLIIIWANNTSVALLICATIVAFFPLLSNTMAGLGSVDRNLLDMFQIYRAGRWQTLRRLQIPSALPFFLAGLRISGGLALVGAVVAEFVAGSGGQEAGLAYRILEAGYRLQFPKMFAGLALISGLGIAIYLVTSCIAHLCLRNWHESALPRER